MTVSCALNHRASVEQHGQEQIAVHVEPLTAPNPEEDEAGRCFARALKES